MNVPAVLAALTGLIPELVLACDHALSQIDILCPLYLTVQMVDERGRVVLMLLNASWQCTPY